MQEHVLYIKNPGPRPPYYQVADHVWGPGCDLDSDGNSATRDDRTWTELTLILRSSPDLRVEIHPASVEPLVLAIRSSHRPLCLATAEYLVATSGGILRESEL